MFRDVHILIVEPDNDERALYRRVVSSMTFAVDTCGSMAEALEMIEEADILIIDLLLRNGPGNLLLQRWTEMRKGPAIIVSENIALEQENELLAVRAWNVLHKPFPMDTLRGVLQRCGEAVLEHKRLVALETKVSQLEARVARAQRMAWILAIIAAATGAAADPLIALLTGG